jgi:15-cis-phytoene synthase
MSPDEYCQQKAAQSGSSFYYSFLFLPTERRRAITALYAFCREVDDVVDECADMGVAATKLAWWRTEIGRLYEGNPAHPVTRALQPLIGPFGIEQARLTEIIDGMEMDLQQTRYLDFPALQRYCYHVAGVVGILAARIFGCTHPQTIKYAETLGTALQLTNIIRDVGEDARKGRIYLPVNELQEYDVKAADILNARVTPDFERLMAFQIGRAQHYYTEALSLLPDEDRKGQRPGLVMAAIYRTLLNEIEQEGAGKVLVQRTALTPIRKLWIAWRTWLRG